MFMSRQEIKVWVGYIAFLFICLLVVTVFQGCDSGWTIAGWEVK